jgi:hypothetical protein
MNDLLILDGPRDPRRHPNPAYRGTFRMHPTHFDDLPEDQEANILFGWFIDEGGELGVVHDQVKAQRLRDLCNSYGTNRNYEVVEACDGEQKPSHGGELLGYDLSQGLNNSLLWWGLRTVNKPPSGDPVVVLADVTFAHFSQQLNLYGLFSEISIAAKCHQALIALQDLRPNFIEGDDLRKFRATAIYHIP